MTLGKQFENTYWYEEGKDQPSASLRIPKTEGVPNVHLRPVIKEDLGTGGLAALDSFREERGITAPLQGMLFSPYVGTGLKKDPTVSPESRREAMDKAAGFNRPVAEYIGRVKAKFGKNIKERAAQGHQEYVREAFDKTDFPVSEMRKTSSEVLVNPQSGRSWAEEYGKVIKLNWDPGRVKKTRVDEKVPTAGKPIPNLKFWDYYDKKLNEPELADDSLLSTVDHWVNPQTGHSYGNLHKEDHPDFEGADHYDMINKLRKGGYVPNLFPGKTPATTKHVGKTVKIEHDWSSSNSYDSRWNYRTMHTRHEPGESTETRTRYESERIPPSVRPATLIHELGHQRDLVLGDKHSYRHTFMRTPDPVEEGIADAHADRYYRHAGLFDDVLESPEEMDDTFKYSGYKPSFHGWKDKLGQAVYIATRLHAQKEPDSYKDIPSRTFLTNSLMTRRERNYGISADPNKVSRALQRNAEKRYNRQSRYDVENKQEGLAERDLSNTLFLGHMVENYPHVRAHLEATGYGDTVAKAHSEYLRRKHGSAEQLNLPGMNKF